VVRETLEDDVELPKIVMAWQSPKHFGPGDAELDLAATALGTGKASRLYKALVYDQKIAQAVDASQESGTLGSRFTVSVLAKPGVDLAKLEAAVDKELAAMRAAPIKDEELTRAKNLVETAFIARLQGVKDRAALLNMYEAEVKDPGYAQKDLARYRDATKDAVMATVAKVLVPDARVILRVVPRAKAKKESPTKEMKK
jgi:zinc protease